MKLNSPDIDRRLDKGPDLVSANFVIPYPPGFPIMVPGQVISREIITFMRKLDVKEIHGYHAAAGLKLLKPDALAARQKAAGRADRARGRARRRPRRASKSPTGDGGRTHAAGQQAARPQPASQGQDAKR